MERTSKEQACTLLGLSITQIVLGGLSIVWALVRLFILMISPLHLAYNLVDLAIAILLFATGHYGTSLSWKARKMTGRSSSFRTLGILNIVLSVTYGLCAICYTVFQILIWCRTDLGGVIQMMNVYFPLHITFTVMPVWVVLLITVAELVIAAIAAKISRQISATSIGQGSEIAYTVQSSGPAAYTEQPLLGTNEKA